MYVCMYICACIIKITVTMRWKFPQAIIANYTDKYK